MKCSPHEESFIGSTAERVCSGPALCPMGCDTYLPARELPVPVGVHAQPPVVESAHLGSNPHCVTPELCVCGHELSLSGPQLPYGHNGVILPLIIIPAPRACADG